MVPEVNRSFSAGENGRLYRHLGKGMGFEDWATSYNIVPVVPTVADPNRPDGWLVGAQNKCRECHAMTTMATCQLFGPDSADMAIDPNSHPLGYEAYKNTKAQEYPLSHWMPRAAPGVPLPNVADKDEWLSLIHI